MFFNIIGGSGGSIFASKFLASKMVPHPHHFSLGIHRTQDHARVAIALCCRFFLEFFKMHVLISQKPRVSAPPPGCPLDQGCSPADPLHPRGGVRRGGRRGVRTQTNSQRVTDANVDFDLLIPCDFPPVCIASSHPPLKGGIFKEFKLLKCGCICSLPRKLIDHL